MDEEIKHTTTQGEAVDPASALLAESGLEPLLRYIANPAKYIRAHCDSPECADAQMADWDGWAKSRAQHIYHRLFPANGALSSGGEAL